MDIYWLWLRSINGIGPVTSKRLIAYYKNVYDIYKASKENLEHSGVLNKKQLEQLISSKSLKNAEMILNDCKKKNIKILCYDDEFYKKKVKLLPKSPIVLFYRGNLIKEGISVGIVGSRRCTDYGKRVAVETAEYLSQNNVPVISGMAKGIDSYAHTACLKSNGYTIAFLGSGADICYPAEHSNLMKKIIDNGVVISEFLPTTRPIQSNFAKRNYLLSAWCEKLLVVEASEKSGALTTAKFAKENNTEVYALPNSIYAEESKGTNKLIQEGAKIYLDPNQLLNSLSMINASTQKKISTQELSPLQHRVLTLIGNNSKTLEEILFSIEENKEKIIEALSIMEIEGVIDWTPQGVTSNSYFSGKALQGVGPMV